MPRGFSTNTTPQPSRIHRPVTQKYARVICRALLGQSPIQQTKAPPVEGGARVRVNRSPWRKIAPVRGTDPSWWALPQEHKPRKSPTGESGAKLRDPNDSEDGPSL